MLMKGRHEPLKGVHVVFLQDRFCQARKVFCSLGALLEHQMSFKQCFQSHPVVGHGLQNFFKGLDRTPNFFFRSLQYTVFDFHGFPIHFTVTGRIHLPLNQICMFYASPECSRPAMMILGLSGPGRVCIMGSMNGLKQFLLLLNGA